MFDTTRQRMRASPSLSILRRCMEAKVYYKTHAVLKNTTSPGQCTTFHHFEPPPRIINPPPPFTPIPLHTTPFSPLLSPPNNSRLRRRHRHLVRLPLVLPPNHRVRRRLNTDTIRWGRYINGTGWVFRIFWKLWLFWKLRLFWLGFFRIFRIFRLGFFLAVAAVLAPYNLLRDISVLHRGRIVRDEW